MLIFLSTGIYRAFFKNYLQMATEKEITPGSHIQMLYRVLYAILLVTDMIFYDVVSAAFYKGFPAVWLSFFCGLTSLSFSGLCSKF
jgi:hypothetical protein